MDKPKINLELLYNPPQSMFKIFGEPDEDKRKEKICLIAKELMTKKFNLPDEERNYPNIYAKLAIYGNPYRHLFYEFGEFSGLLGFLDIYYGYKADVMLKIWDESVWNKTLMRQLIDITDMVARELKLKRLNTETADEKVKRLAEMGGFKVEGKRANDFMYDGILYTNFFMGKEY